MKTEVILLQLDSKLEDIPDVTKPCDDCGAKAQKIYRPHEIRGDIFLVKSRIASYSCPQPPEGCGVPFGSSPALSEFLEKASEVLILRGETRIADQVLTVMDGIRSRHPNNSFPT